MQEIKLEYGHAEFSVYDQGAVQDILDTAIESVMTGASDAKTALDNAPDSGRRDPGSV